MLQNPARFQRVAVENRDYILGKSGSPERMTRKIEAIFESLVREKSSVWTRPHNRVATIDGSQRLLGELLFRQSRLENLLEMNCRARVVGEHELRLDLDRKRVASEELKVAEHSKYCAMKEQELAGAWNKLNAHIAARPVEVSEASIKQLLTQLFEKITKRCGWNRRIKI